MRSDKQKLHHTVCFVLLFLLLCGIYFHQQLFLGPSYMHAWAQGDRYSLAVNFYDNGMNFFEPCTSNLYSRNGITGVEFPIQAYLAAALGHIFGRDNISICFKLITIAISGAGLYALFLTIYKRTKDVIFSLLTPFLVFCSPVFVYYTCNYLPDTAGTSFAFIAFYHTSNYLDTNEKKSYYTALALLTLGTLIKTSIAIYLLGFIGIAFLYRTFGKERQQPKSNIGFYLLSILSLLLIVANYKRNTWLSENYAASIFLSKAMPFESWASFKDYVNGAFKTRWVCDYVAWPTYFVIFALVGPGVFIMRKSRTGKKYASLLGAFLLGSIGVFYLMGEQLSVHDYYFIAIVMPLIAFALVSSIIYIYGKGIAIFPLRIAFIAVLGVSLFIGFGQFKKRFDEPTDLYRWTLNGAKTLDELGISRKEHVLIVNEHASNLPLTYLDRRGFNFYHENWDYDFATVIYILQTVQARIIVMRAETEQKIKESNPAAFLQFDHLITKDEMAVYRFKN